MIPAHWADFLRSLPVPAVITDLDGATLVWNEAASTLLEWPAPHKRRSDVPDFVKGAPRWFQHLRSEVLTGETSAATLIRRRSAAGLLSLRVTAGVLPDTQGRKNCLIFTLQDVTRWRRHGNAARLTREAEDALRRSEENLRQAQKMEAVGRLAGGIAHDFNNLLTAIKGHAQFLVEDLPESESSFTDAVEIKRAVDRAAALIRQLLIFSRKEVLEPQILDLNLTVTEMHSLLRRVIREDIALQLDLGEELWPIRADSSQMEQVIMNLTVNARDAMPHGGTLNIRTRNIELHGETEMAGTTLPPGRYVHVVVRDTGFGMDRETQARIFEPFFTTKAEGEGTGLGLATVYGIVRQSGGAIMVYSEPGQGTMLKMLFPAADEEHAEQPEAPVAADPAEQACGWESVLVVEDDPGIRVLTSRALQGRGYSVLEAESGPDALRLAQEYEGPIDLVITDIVMPEMSGRRLAETMHDLHPTARILFMSGFTPEEVVRQGLLEPHAKFLEKPFNPESLARKVREVLDDTR
jgi:two-component system cell cycle sensor histidine kinase/response regulator CckA